MSLSNLEQEQDFLVVSYKPEKNELSIKQISDLSSVDLRNDYIHFKEKLKPTPIEIMKTYAFHHEYIQYFVLEKYELNRYKSCRFKMRASHVVSITKTQNGYHHGVIKHKNVIVWEEMIESKDMDVFVCVVYTKATFVKVGKIDKKNQLVATFKF